MAMAAWMMGVAAVAAVLAWHAKPDATIPVRRFDLPAAIARGAGFSIAPDGTRIAYIADGHVWVHTLRTAGTHDVGTVSRDTVAVFWSPDGQRLAYSSDSTLRVVPAAGGAAFTVCRVPGSGRLLDGVWRDDGTIAFVVWREHAYRVPESGGTPAVVSAIDPDTEIDFHAITALPGDRFVVTTHLRGQDAARLDLVDGTSRTPLADDLDIDFVRFRPPDRLLFLRLRTNAGVWVVPFGGGRPDLTTARLIQPGANGRFDISQDGTLVARFPPVERRELVWVSAREAAGDRAAGTPYAVESVPGQPFESLSSPVALAPDGRRAVVTIRPASGKEEFFVRDLVTGADTALAPPVGPTGVVTGAAISWTPAGRLLYPAGGVEALQVYDWPADGSRGGRALVAGVAARMTRDGRTLLFARDERARMRLYRAELRADGSVGPPDPVFAGSDAPVVRWFDVSPDGEVLAFTITDPVTSRLDVFVATYPGLKERRQVTSGGGAQPRFSRDGRRLYFLSGALTQGTLARGRLEVVAVETGPLAVGPRRTLLTEEAAPGAPTVAGFDVAADGRLLMTRVLPAAPGDGARIVLLQNWPLSVR
jgi:dipeptidyl aminopeptidase/acylaminoacyl peptidase